MLEVRLLGRLTITGGDDRATESIRRQPKRLILLAYLATEGPARVRRESLLSLFWPQMEPSRARHALRQALYFLKRHLGEDLAAVGDGTELWCDAREFEQLARGGRVDEAMRLYSGEFLAGIEAPDASPELGDWMRQTRDRLRDLAADTAQALSELREEQGDLTGAVGWARTANQLDALSEVRTRRLVELLDREGSRAAALAVYAGLYRRLQERYDLDPTSETLAGVSRIRERIASRQTAAHSITADQSTSATFEQDRIKPSISDTPSSAPSASAPDGVTLGGQPVGGTLHKGGRRDPSAAPTRPPTGVAATRARTVLPWILLGGLLGAVAFAVFHALPRSHTPVSTSRVAVFPFVVNAEASQAYLARGLVTLLSAGLDGAGSLTAADPDAVLRATARQRTAWTSARASRVAGDLGAGLYVLGSVTAVPGDQLRLTASVFAIGESDPISRASVDGRAGELLGLVNELTVELTSGLPNAGETGSPRRLLRTASLEAWKHYLTGLEQLRSGRSDVALASFRSALALDTAFLRAAYALSVAADRALPPGQAEAALNAVAERIDRLPPHEQDLTRARFAYLQGRATVAESVFRRLTDEYPNDEEGWYGLGRVLMDLGPLSGRRSAEAKRILERAAELDPVHADVRYRLAQLDLLAGDRASAIHDAELGLGAGPNAGLRDRLRAFRSMQARRDDTLRVLIASADDDALFAIARDIAVLEHSLPPAESVLAALDSPSRAPSTRLQARLFLADLALAGGRWEEARQQIARAAQMDPLPADERLALYASLPWLAQSRPALREARERILGSRAPADSEAAPLDSDPTSARRAYLAGLLSIRLAEPGETSRFERDLDRLALGTPVAASLERALAAAADRDPSRTVELLAGVSAQARPGEIAWSPFASGPEVRYLRATSLAASGRAEPALDWLAALGEQSIPDLALAAPAYLEEARILARLGRGQESQDAYAKAARLWSQADAPLAAWLRREGPGGTEH